MYWHVGREGAHARVPTRTTPNAAGSIRVVAVCGIRKALVMDKATDMLLDCHHYVPYEYKQLLY